MANQNNFEYPTKFQQFFGRALTGSDDAFRVPAECSGAQALLRWRITTEGQPVSLYRRAAAPCPKAAAALREMRYSAPSRPICRSVAQLANTMLRPNLPQTDRCNERDKRKFRGRRHTDKLGVDADGDRYRRGPQ